MILRARPMLGRSHRMSVPLQLPIPAAEEEEAMLDAGSAHHRARPPRPRPSDAAIASAFAHIDGNGNGVLSPQEVTRALRMDPELRQLLGLPAVIRGDDGSRMLFDVIFERLDRDGSGELDLAEFSALFADLDEAAAAADAKPRTLKQIEHTAAAPA